MSLLLALSVGFSATGQMKFSLATEKQQYRMGEPIKLAWRLYNGTNQSWVVYRADVGVRENFPQITFSIEGPSGRHTLSLLGDEKATTLDACRLPPGQTLQTNFDLTEWAAYLDYRIPPGKYGISATFAHAARESRGILKGQPVARCGSAGPATKAQPAEIWDGTLTAPQISFTVQ